MTTTAAPHSPNVPAPVPQAAAPITFTPAMIAQLLGAELDGRGDLVLSDVGGLENATSSTLTFIRSPHYALKWPGSKAGAALVTRGVQVDGHDRASRALLVVPDADMAMLKLLEVAAKRIPIHRPPVGIHPSAVVDPTAVIAPSVAVGPGCVIGPGTRIGENSVLHANVTLGMGVVIGASTILYPGVVVYDRCIVGSRCLINAGVVLGADGFGYLPDPSGRGLVKIPHIGIVEIHDDVEIGAGSCIDRGKFGSTLIGQGTKIDNLVQIAHNCRIGKGVIICGQCGLAGSVTIGDGAMLGGEVGVVDNIAIGAGARIAAKSGVLNNVAAGETSIGYPAMPGIEGQRNFAAIRHLAELAKEVKRLSRIVGEGTGRGNAPKA